MSNLENPTAIARDALRTLAARRVAPTPDNYRKIYVEIAGVASPAAAAENQALHDAIAAVPADTAWRKVAQKFVDEALHSQDWDGARKALTGLLKLLADTSVAPHSESSLPASWKDDIAAVFHQWDVEHVGWTRARKRKSIEHALLGPGHDPHRIFSRLRNTMMQWKDRGEKPDSIYDGDKAESIDAGDQPASPSPTAPSTPDAPEAPADLLPEISLPALTPQLCECLAGILDGPLPLLLTRAPQLANEARALAAYARGVKDSSAAHELIADTTELTRRIARAAPGDDSMRESLLALLQLLIGNMHELLSGDQWLRGQLEVVQQVLGRPLSVDSIANAENAVRALMAKQLTLRETVDSARSDLKSLVQSFLDRLADLASSTDLYQGKLQDYSSRIEQADDIHSLGTLLGDLVADTRAMQDTTNAVRGELSLAHNRVEHAEVRIREMESELAQMTERTREDPLTGAMNRRGLEGAFQAGAATADAAGKSLCVALIDIDNFKMLNDRFGHLAGDAALRHLVDVIKSNLRAQDEIARFGGEEFVLLLPNTDAAKAVEIMIRLQRLLTKHFFLYKQERMLITFSCGTAMRSAGETLEVVLERADRAMYSAKQSGKNRVVAADASSSELLISPDPDGKIAS